MKGMHAGPLSIERDSSVSGMVAGDVIVRAGVAASISGMIDGDVIVEPGAVVNLSGMVSGAIVNHGGDVVVTGLVAG